MQFSIDQLFTVLTCGALGFDILTGKPCTEATAVASIQTNGTSQANQTTTTTTANQTSSQADAVREAFLHSWNGYSQFAFGADELRSVSNQPSNSRNGWGATIVDALSTAILMGLNDIVDTQLEYISTIDFTDSHTSDGVSLFETTIRYLAGMLAAYDLLTGPYPNLASNASHVDALLAQSKVLADALKFAFDTPSGVPSNNLQLRPPAISGDITGLAVSGSLVLEWTRLSDILNDTSFGDLAQRGEEFLLNPNQAGEPFPGLLGTNINITTGEFVDNSGGWNGGDDSFYEYLIKMWVYDPTRFSSYRDRWVLAADSTIEFLGSQSGPYTFVAGYDGQQLSLNEGHLTCFIGGNFLLGGTVLDNSDYIDFGLLMVDSCHGTYNSTATRIGPEAFSWDPSNVPSSQRNFFATNGFYITNGGYDLRPEVIESYYYAYKITGDTKYQDWTWDAFAAINSTCRTDSAFSSVSDVNRENGGQQTDLMESFWFAEVMKYTYLVFADSEVGVVKGDGQKWVFNTEAHPFKVVG